MSHDIYYNWLDISYDIFSNVHSIVALISYDINGDSKQPSLFAIKSNSKQFREATFAKASSLVL